MKKIITLGLLISLLSIASLYAATSDNIQKIQGDVPPETPAVSDGQEQKGYVASVLADIFDSTYYQIKNSFIFALRNLPTDDTGNNTVPRWTGESFVVSDIWEIVVDGDAKIGIGTKTPAEKLDVAGRIQADAFLYSSDRNLKTNIRPYSDAGDVVDALGAYRYSYKDSGREDVGLIAQEVEEVFPEAVSRGTDGYLSVDYAKLVVPLLQKVQEQEARISELEKLLK